MNREEIVKEIQKKNDLINDILLEIKELKILNCLLCDEHQRYSEEEIEFLISRRPKKTVKRLIGRIHWVQEFKDEIGETISINRSSVVREDGKWLI